MPKEIEKKYLVHSVPTYIEVKSSKTIYQTYLAIGSEEIRVRKIHKDSGVLSYTMTIKKGSGLVREELEFDISSDTYEQLLETGNRKPLIKTRQKLLIGDLEFDFDVYENTSTKNLKTIEIEFSSEEEAHSFIEPDWFSLNVTEDKQYKNQNLWKAIQ